MLRQVVVGTVRDAPQLAPAEREHELEVGRRLGIEGEFFRFVVAQTEVFLADAEAGQPVITELAPIGKPLKVRAGLAEELKLHLLKLADAENEVAGRDLVAEALADLRNAERDLAAGGALDVFEVDEDALCGFRAQVDLRGIVFRHTLVCFEHQVEFADVGEVALAAAGAGDGLFADERDHILVGHCLDVRLGIAGFVAPVLDELVCAVTHFTGFAVDERIVERGDMAGGDPHLRIHENGGVEADIIRVFLDEFFPPGFFNVVFQLDAERTVVPGVGETAVNFGAGVYEAASFAERDDLIHCFVGVFHGFRTFPLIFSHYNRYIILEKRHLSSVRRCVILKNTEWSSFKNCLPVESVGWRSHRERRSIERGVAQLVARLLWEQDAAGSNPVTPTNNTDLFFIER